MSVKPKPYIAKPKPAEPMTWEAFARTLAIVRFDIPLGACITRIKYRQATSVLIRLAESGCSFRIDDEKLLVAPANLIGEDDRKMIGLVRDEMIHLIREGILNRGQANADA